MNLQLSRGAVILLLLSLLAGLLPLSGQVKQASAGGAWSAWLYNDMTGQLARVHPDGTVETYEFPLPFGVSSLPYAFAFTRDGDRMAVCLTDDAGMTSVRVYDIRAALYRGVYEAPGMVQGCWLEQYSFSENGALLAVGLFNHYPDPADPRPEWELIVMNSETGAVIERLTARDPQIAALGIDIRGTIPAVVTFEPQTPAFPGEIAFMPVLYGTEGMQEYHSLIWRLDDGTVRAGGYHGKGGLDLLLPTGEFLFLDLYDFLPTGRLEGPGYLYNVVLYGGPSGDPYPVYHGGEAVLGSPTFIDGGRRMAVYRYSPPGPPDWLMINRDGTSAPLPISAEAYRVWGLPDGYLYLTDRAPTPEAPALYHARFLPDNSITTTELWRGVLGDFWRVVWVTSLAAPDGLAPFEPFPLLGEPPVMTPTATLPPAIPPTATLPPAIPLTPTLPPVVPPPGLGVGGTALVQTTEGDTLRARTGPGLGYAVAFLMPNGTLVTLREGPVAADGYSWWRVEAPDGRSGWAVDGVPEGLSGWLQTLVPAGG